ncbi:hypothetical protein D3C71_1190300 [compost metagenome]
MFPLSNLNPLVQAVLLTTDLTPMEKIAFHNMTVLLFKDVSIEGKLLQQPVIVVDKLNNDPALIMVVKFTNADLDQFTYTFQFECWPTDKLQQVDAPWMPGDVKVVPKPKMKLSFLAERNSVVYFDQAFEGTFQETLKQMAQVLGR